ncbi:hypothetical protein [Amycolatopsis thermoflava]|uniref:hypothetical protein n=1 Tax=Amycolatopsis thermoflava TaxID=84480 RepID=UPI0004023122|nr:hypothetical protein [Amycolatopsis thermoflava]
MTDYDPELDALIELEDELDHDPWEAEPDWYDEDDDLLRPGREEPYCCDCNDSGTDWRGRRCRECNPSRLQRWWWRITWRFHAWRNRRQLAEAPWGPPPAEPADPAARDEGPF